MFGLSFFLIKKLLKKAPTTSGFAKMENYAGRLFFYWRKL